MSGERCLPLRIAPDADETLVGFVVRLAARNGRADVRAFSRTLGVPFAEMHEMQFRLFDLGRLAEAAGADARTLEGMAYWTRGRRLVGFMGHSLDRQLIVSSGRKACPRCLAASRRHRAIWDLTVSSACAEHAVALISGCPKCARPLDWNGPAIDLCRCGFRLRGARCSALDALAIQGMAAVAEAFGCPRSAAAYRPPALRDLEPGDYLRLALQIGWCVSGRNGLAHPDRLPAGDRDLSPFLERGHRAVREWPSSFRECLEVAAVDGGGKGRYGDTPALRPLVRWALTLGRWSRLGRLVWEELDGAAAAGPRLGRRIGRTGPNVATAWSIGRRTGTEGPERAAT